MTEPDLFDELAAQEGERRKAEGQSHALTADSLVLDVWRANAYEILRAWGQRREAFTSTDLIDVLGMPPRPNAVGAVMTAAAKKGLIAHTDRYVKSTRPTCHAAVVRVWTRVSR
jgi:hypothetical protein